MKIAIPLANGLLCQHFGHCEQFAFFDVSPDGHDALEATPVAAPEHAPGLLPRWLQERGVDVVVAGGMGSRAQALFAQAGVRVITGAPSVSAEQAVRDFLAGTLVTGDNACDH
jgi:ATP-binding protein involved in chromosome partitioning